MRRKRDYVDYLQDILGAIEKVERFTEGMDFRQFSADDKTVFAVIRALEVIGEASKKIPLAVQRQSPEMPWREMAGIQDKLIHEYFGVNLNVVWKTVQEDLPPLKAPLARIVKNVSPESKDNPD